MICNERTHTCQYNHIPAKNKEYRGNEMSEKEILTAFMEVFPNEGHVVPMVEIKFRLAARFGAEKVDDILDELVTSEVLSRFEFNNTVHYKAKKDIPLSLKGGSSGNNGETVPAPEVSVESSGQLADLSKLVVAIAKATGNPTVRQLLEEYQEKYN